MGKDVRNTKKMLDYIKLIISLVALVIIVGGLIYKSKGVIYPIDVNIVLCPVYRIGNLFIKR